MMGGGGESRPTDVSGPVRHAFGHARLWILKHPQLGGIWIVAALLWLGAATSLWAVEPVYRLQIGDVISISVAGFPELSQHATIQIDGRITDVLLGRVDAAGFDIAELQSRIRELQSNRLYQKLTSTGQTIAVRISPDAITLDIASYRPVYVDGDVAKPGELAFRPGLNVRQAIALAGGYDLLQGKLTDAERLLQAADLRSEADHLIATREATRDKMGALRVILGLQKGDTQDKSGRPEPTTDRTGLSEALGKSSERHMALILDEIAKDKSFRETLIRDADEQLNILRDRQVKENDGMQNDLADYERLQALLRQGSATLLRVSDARRAWQFSAVQSLQTVSKIADVELERTRALEELNRITSRRQADLESELSDCLVQQTTNEARLVAVREKLRYLGGLRAGLLQSKASEAVAITVRRQLDDPEHPIVASGSTGLMPGDVLDVRLEDAYAVLGQ
jgi:polysaccharide export outer membrane protein